MSLLNLELRKVRYSFLSCYWVLDSIIDSGRTTADHRSPRSKQQAQKFAEMKQKSASLPKDLNVRLQILPRRLGCVLLQAKLLL